MPIDTGLWTAWGTGTQDETGGTLNQSPSGTSGQYVGVFSVSTYDFTNRSAIAQIAQLPNAVAGVQAYLRCEIDASNAVIIGYSDTGTLFMQHQLAGATTTVDSEAWPVGTIGIKLVFDNAQSLLWFATTADGITWTSRFSEALPIATTALRVVIGAGCYQAVATPGTVRWESTGVAVAVYKNLTGTSVGSSTSTGAARTRRSLTGTSVGLAAAAGASTARRSLVANSAGVALAVGGFAISGLARGVAIADATIIRGRRVTPLPLLAITDDFNDGSMAAIWTTKSTGGTGGTIVESGGGLNVTIPANAGVIEVMRGYATAATYDLTNKAVQVELVQRGSLETSSQAVLRVEVASDPANSYVEVGQSGASILYKFRSNQGAPAWPAGARFLRIEFDNGPTGTGAVYWDWSANGSTWTAITTSRYPVASLGDVTACRVLVIGKSFLGNVTAPLPAIFDNFDIPVRPLTGTATGVSTTTAATSSRRSLVGLSTGVAAVSISALLRGRSLTAASTAVATAAATLTRRRSLAAASGGSATASAAPTARRSLSGSSAGAATAPTVQISKPGIVTNASNGRATTSATLNARRSITASSAGLASTTAAPTRRRVLLAVATATSTATASVSDRRALLAASVGKATATALASARRLLGTVSSAGRTTALGIIGLKGSLFALSRGTTSVSVTVTARRSLTVTSTGSGTASAQVRRGVSLGFVSSAGKATATGQIVRTLPSLVAHATGTASATALVGRKRSLVVSSAGTTLEVVFIGRKRSLAPGSAVAGRAVTTAAPTRRRSMTVMSVGHAATSGTVSVRIALSLVYWDWGGMQFWSAATEDAAPRPGMQEITWATDVDQFEPGEVVKT